MKEQNVKKGFSRRSFLKGSVSLGVGVSLFGLTACAPAKKVEQPKVEQTSTSGAKTLTYHACPRNCHDTCALISEKVDGRIVRIVGDPDNPLTAGTPCVKGHTHINVLYHPDRLLYPMKRAGKKGEKKWERITWDEAYETITSKFKETIDKYGSEAIMPYTFSGTFGQVQEFGVPWRFWNKIGATKIDLTVCETAGMEALAYTYGDFSSSEPEDYAKTKCFVAWGSNESYTNVHAVKYINQARDNGAKLLVVNPHRHPLASQADIFIQLKPATDAAFALGVANVIISENLYDKDFVEKYTIGFDKLKAKVKEFPLDKVSKITGISIDQIQEFARVYAQSKPSMIRMGYGFQRRTNGGTMCKAISLLPALTGVMGMDGGGFAYINFNHWPLDMKYMMKPELLGDRKVRIINMNEFSKAISGTLPTTKEKPIKALFIWSGNPVPSGTNVNLTIKGLEREDLFTVVFDMFVTDTADYADILLPAAHFIEVEEVNCDYLGHYVRYNKPGLDPMGESKSNLQVFNELGQKMGYTEDCFKETAGEVIKNALMTNSNPAFKDITYESLQEKHWFHVDLGVAWADQKYKTPSGKIEFYSEQAAKKGFDPVAEHVPELESKEKSPQLFAKYPINLITPASAQLLSSEFHNVPYIRENLGDPFVTMNKADADARGIKEGDYVFVANDRGKIKLKVKVSQSAVRPGVAVSYKSYWSKLTDGQTVNKLSLDAVGDMGGVSTFNTNLVQISKA